MEVDAWRGRGVDNDIDPPPYMHSTLQLSSLKKDKSQEGLLRASKISGNKRSENSVKGDNSPFEMLEQQ